MLIASVHKTYLMVCSHVFNCWLEHDILFPVEHLSVIDIEGTLQRGSCRQPNKKNNTSNSDKDKTINRKILLSIMRTTMTVKIAMTTTTTATKRSSATSTTIMLPRGKAITVKQFTVFKHPGFLIQIWCLTEGHVCETIVCLFGGQFPLSHSKISSFLFLPKDQTRPPLPRLLAVTARWPPLYSCRYACLRRVAVLAVVMSPPRLCISVSTVVAP